MLQGWGLMNQVSGVRGQDSVFTCVHLWFQFIFRGDEPRGFGIIGVICEICGSQRARQGSNLQPTVS